MDFPSFVGSSNESQVFSSDQEDTINFYEERSEVPGATSRSALCPTPGVESKATFGATIGRANFFMDGRQFAVIDKYFIEIDSAYGQTTRGTVKVGTNPATISSNGSGGGQLFITSGDNGYVYDLTTNTLTEIAALVGLATMGDQLDGYFLALDATTSTLYISNLTDGATWTTGVDFAQRSISPDPWTSMKVSGRYIYLFGTQTSEVWYDAGASFPFAPHPSGSIEYGIAAQFSPKVVEGSIVWLGASRDGITYMLRTNGFTPEVISTYALQTALSGYTTIADAQGDSYNDLGHTFYMITFPTEDVTWAWDVQLGKWAKRGTWIAEDNRYVAWRPRWHAAAFGEHRMLDAATGDIYRMSSDLTSDVDSRVIRRLRRTPCLTEENERIFWSSLEIHLDAGLGLTTGQGSNPQVMLRVSRDGGRTFGTERMRSAGAIGHYGQRVIWNRIGMARQLVVEVTMTDPIPYRITGASLKTAQAIRGAA